MRYSSAKRVLSSYVLVNPIVARYAYDDPWSCRAVFWLGEDQLGHDDHGMTVNVLGSLLSVGFNA